MQKSLVLFIAVGLTAVVSACSYVAKSQDQSGYSLPAIKSSQPCFNYEIDTEVFKRMDINKQIEITIDYPQIKCKNDIAIQMQINEQIKNAALIPYIGVYNLAIYVDL